MVFQVLSAGLVSPAARELAEALAPLGLTEPVERMEATALAAQMVRQVSKEPPGCAVAMVRGVPAGPVAAMAALVVMAAQASQSA